MADVKMITQYKPCPECGGRGWLYSRYSSSSHEPCKHCWGTGLVSHAVAITATNEIPLQVPPYDRIDELRAEIAELRQRIERLESEINR